MNTFDTADDTVTMGTIGPMRTMSTMDAKKFNRLMMALILGAALLAGLAYCYFTYSTGFDDGYKSTTMGDYLRTLQERK